MNYFEQEELKRAELTDAILEELEKELSLELRAVMKKLLKEIESMTVEQMDELISRKELNEIKRQAAGSGHNDDEYYKSIIKAAKLTIAGALVFGAVRSIDSIYLSSEGRYDAFLKESANLMYKMTGKSWDAYINKVSGLGSVPDEVWNKILNDNWSGLHYTERLIEHRKTFINNLLKNLKGIDLMSDSKEDIRRKLDKLFTSSDNILKRLLRTEQAHAMESAKYEAFKELNVYTYQFTAVLDHRTSHTCRGLNNTIYRMENYSQGSTAPPMHPNCRSTIIPAIMENYGEPRRY